MNRLIKTMAVSSALCIVLLFIRIQWSGTISYIFLAWNLFLAWIPFLFAALLRESKASKRPGFILFLLFACWLLFFPNSPYIITDLFHLRQKHGIPLWYDLVLILFFAWNGLMLGFASLFDVREVLKQVISIRLVNIFITLLMVLCSFGIYLGRFPRWNSWDIISNPLALFADIFNMLLNPSQNTRMIGVTFFFSLFLIAVYWTLIAMFNNFKTEENGAKKV
ncbi:MAG TPA: DUF1361 domain-containing protein [Bacteroidia bacterium]|jgi:uncharacterized membrane protein